MKLRVARRLIQIHRAIDRHGLIEFTRGTSVHRRLRWLALLLLVVLMGLGLARNAHANILTIDRAVTTTSEDPHFPDGPARVISLPDDWAQSRSGHTGMGLGFFIAKTLLERTGAKVTFENGARGGAVVAARWSRPAIEAPVLPDFPSLGA